MTNRHGVTSLVLGSLFTLAASCSGSDKAAIFTAGGDTSGGSGNRAGSGGRSGKGGTGGEAGAIDGGGATAGGSSGTGGSAGGGTVSPLGPQISITNPVEATDPNVGPVVIGDQVTVLCLANESTLSGAKPVDPSTIKIAMLDDSGSTIKSIAGTPTVNANEYSAAFILTAVTSGPIAFKCTAGDTSSPAHLGEGTVNTLFDHGPDIAQGQPLSQSAHNLRAPMNVEFTVSAAPIAADDSQADVSGVTLQVAGKKIDLVSMGAGAYKTSIDFNALFPAPPSGPAPILITATNKRTNPGKATNALSYNFVIDGTGPAIAITSPVAGAVIGPAAVLSFTVTDSGSGVDSQTIAVKLNDTPYYYDSKDLLWSTDGAGNYTYKMGNRLEGDSTDSQVTVEVLASDKAQNPSSGNSLLFHLDTFPPIVDLDPPPTFFTRPGAAPNSIQCSDLFDPVGSEAPSDLSTLLNFGRFRSLVWDETNANLGQAETYPALTDQGSVRLYVQPDTTQPLLRRKSTLPGVTCDEIWTGLAPDQKNPDDLPLPFFKLTAIPSESSPQGTVDWAVTPSLKPTASECEAGPTSASTKVCGGNSPDMSMVIHHPVVRSPHEPVIYAVQPDLGSTTKSTCTGGQWQIAAAIKNASMMAKRGWICLAARAVDTVGNIGISAPLRICLDDGAGGDPCAGTPPPSCTDSCIAPPHFQVQPVPFDKYN